MCALYIKHMVEALKLTIKLSKNTVKHTRLFHYSY